MSASPQPAPGPACVGRDPAIWFPNSEREGRYDQARSICLGCPVRAQCLADVMAWERGQTGKMRHGMFGALSPHERARLHRTGKMPDEGQVRGPRAIAVKVRAARRAPGSCWECGDPSARFWCEKCATPSTRSEALPL